MYTYTLKPPPKQSHKSQVT